MKLYRALRIQRQELVAFVGGGGKTSAMFRLGDELAEQGWRAVSTTSTHIGADQVHLPPHTIIRPDQQPFEECIQHLRQQLPAHPHTLLVGEINPEIARATGLTPAEIDQLFRLSLADVVINEADGARTLPFKAPADHEPVITAATTLVVPVVGIDSIGQPLDATHVHRPERIAALSGAQLGQAITPQTIARTLGHPQGGLKGVPPSARVVVLINKVHSAAQWEIAQELAGALLAPVASPIEAVAIGAVQAPDPVQQVKGQIGIVLLAAGESRRFGRFKQLLPWGESGTLMTHAVDIALASQARPVVVVLGCQAQACRAALGERPVKIVVNPRWQEGQSTSVQAGLAALPERSSGALFHLADLPGVTPEVIDALIARHETTLASVVWPEYQGRRGNPVLFDHSLFSEFQTLSGDVGAKPVLLAHARAGNIERVAVNVPGILQDIDRPADLT